MTERRQLLDRAAVAELLGVNLKTIDKIRERTRNGTARVPFPPETVRYGSTPLWTRQQIVKYGQQRQAAAIQANAATSEQIRAQLEETL
jgi:uncharacterized protein YfaA (DUF2138 family)